MTIADQLRHAIQADPRSVTEITRTAGTGCGGRVRNWLWHGSANMFLSTATKLADALDCDIVLVKRAAK